MIKEWRLKSFKSVRSETNLPLRPLTVLTGPNSSGKSSLLQSILLIQQTLLSKVSRRQLVLNGDLVKLGTFTDVRSEDASDDEFSIGFTLNVDLSPESRRRRVQSSPYLYPHFHHFVDGGTGNFGVFLTFGPTVPSSGKDTPKPSNLQAELRTGDYVSAVSSVEQSKTGEHNWSTPSLKIERRTALALQKLMEGVEVPNPMKIPDEQVLRYSVNPEFARHAAKSEGYFLAGSEKREHLDFVAVHLDHFLPAVFVVKYPVTRRKLYMELRTISENEVEKWKLCPEKLTTLQQALVKVLKEWETAEDDLPTLHRKARRALRSSRREDDELDSIIDAALKHLNEEDVLRKGLELTPPPEAMGLLAAAVTQEFGILRYLGPLRDEPKPVYNIANSADPTHVGFRGEFTAAVLDLYAHQEVDFLSPDEPDRIRQIPLSEAVSAWLDHLDIAESFHTSEEGKLGHRLFIRPGGTGRSMDLTNVGVGVSQVLPIVVMALISEPGAVLLFEQPELHLHPKVQLHLADFFLAVAKTGRQCIVETHSEYLVNRLRLRVVEKENAKSLMELISLYFVERKGGTSNFQQVTIDEYGAIPDWPDGFFDQGPSESDMILAAAQRKRTAKLKRNTSVEMKRRPDAG